MISTMEITEIKLAYKNNFQSNATLNTGAMAAENYDVNHTNEFNFKIIIIFKKKKTDPHF